MRALIFEGSTPVGKPRDWDETLDGPCGTIHVVTVIDALSGLPVTYSIYRASAEEIAALAAGGVLRFGYVGHGGHPVFQLGVVSPELVDQLGPLVEGLDLGAIISG